MAKTRLQQQQTSPARKKRRVASSVDGSATNKKKKQQQRRRKEGNIKKKALNDMVKGRTCLSELPESLQNDNEFLLSVMKKAPMQWYDLPESKRKDPLFAQSFTFFPGDDKFAVDLLRTCPELRNDWGFWSNLISRRHDWYVELSDLLDNLRDLKLAPPSLFSDNKELMHEACKQDHKVMHLVRRPALNDPELWATYIEKSHPNPLERWLGQHAPLNIRRNKKLMLQACLRNGWILRYVDATLLKQREFVGEVIDKVPTAMAHLPAHIQKLHRDLVKETLAEYADRSFRVFGTVPYNQQGIIASNIVNEFWRDAEFVQNWFISGGYLVPGLLVAGEWAENEELYSWLAMYGGSSQCKRGFGKRLPECLSRNRQFMMKMTEKRPSIYWVLNKAMQMDYEVALLASVSPFEGISDKGKWREECDELDRDLWEFLVTFCQRVRERWAMASAFPGATMTVSSDKQKENPLLHLHAMNNLFLRMWQQGEGSFTPLIRDFAVMPSSNEEFALLRQAVRHLPNAKDIDMYEEHRRKWHIDIVDDLSSDGEESDASESDASWSDETASDYDGSDASSLDEFALVGEASERARRLFQWH